jgi:hypothetical protein
MAEEDEATAGLVEKGSEYPKTQAKPGSTSEYTQTYRLQMWPPNPTDDDLAAAVKNWQDDARRSGLTPAKTADTEVSGEGGLMFIKVTGRVRKAASKE